MRTGRSCRGTNDKDVEGRVIKRPLFKYYGGKFRVAGHYPDPQHPTIVEPFAGAAGYSCRHPDRQVILTDLDEHIVGVWSYLIRTPSAEIRALPVLGPDDCVDDFAIPQEARWLIGFWLNAGVAAPCKAPSSWMRKVLAGEYPSARGSFWSAKNRDRIADEVEKIRHWRVFRRSYADVPNGEATWFVDPPYQIAGNHYSHAADALDFAHLGAWCRAREGQVIVCENDGADWLPFRPFKTIKGMEGARRSGKSVEVVWMKSHE